MGLYDAQKNPFQRNINAWSNARTNDHLQRQTKGIPCHVVKVDKDFVEVQFDTQGSGITPPTVKMPVSYSPYGREPTQVGDKGYAVPSDYHLGAADGWGQGTNYYPRGNLSPLSFQPTAHTDNPKRDYNQNTIAGGPNGILLVQSNPPKQQSQDGQQQGSGGGTSGSGGETPVLMRGPGGRMIPARMRSRRLSRAVPGIGFYVPVATPLDGSAGASGAPSASPGAPASDTLPPVPEPTTTLDLVNKASLQIDQDQKHTLDGTKDHKITIEQGKNKVTIEVKADGSHFVWLGGPGNIPQMYAPVLTTRGPCVDVMGKIQLGDG